MVFKEHTLNLTESGEVIGSLSTSGGSNVQVAGHCFTDTESILNLRPKNFCIGLIRPKVSF